MFVDRRREKLLNAIVFFVSNTKHCHTLKLFKLLHFLDFEHYRQTGRGVTGLTYKAWKAGPAPSELWAELHDPPADLRGAVAITPVKHEYTDELLRRDLKGKKTFDARHFTKRELKIIRLLAEIFQEARGEGMKEFSHLRGSPWDKVFAGGKGESRVIPYDLSLSSPAVLPDMPSLDNDEIVYRKEAFREIDAAIARKP